MMNRAPCLGALKLTELACSGSSPVQATGLVSLTMLAIGLYLWGSVKSKKSNKGGDMKTMKNKKTKSKSKLPTSATNKLRGVTVAVLMTAHAILTSYLGGSPMLA